MKTGPFIYHVAQATGVAEATVKVIARFLREAGYLTSTGARGPNGPDMVPRDAVRLILTLAVSTSPAEAVSGYERVAKMVFSIGNTKDVVETLTAVGFPCSGGQTVEDALTAIMQPEVEVDLGLSFALTSRGGVPYLFECRYRDGIKDVAAHFRPVDRRGFAALSEEFRGAPPEVAEAAAERDLAEFERHGWKAILSPDGFTDMRSFSVNSLLWLRWKAFEGGER